MMLYRGNNNVYTRSFKLPFIQPNRTNSMEAEVTERVSMSETSRAESSQLAEPPGRKVGLE